MIFKATPHQAHTIGQKCRGERIARMAAVGMAIKGKVKGLAPIDLAPFGQAVGLCHADSPAACAARATSRASSTLVISWVSVLRVTTSHDRSPCS